MKLRTWNVCVLSRNYFLHTTGYARMRGRLTWEETADSARREASPTATAHVLTHTERCSVDKSLLTGARRAQIPLDDGWDS